MKIQEVKAVNLKAYKFTTMFLDFWFFRFQNLNAFTQHENKSSYMK